MSSTSRRIRDPIHNLIVFDDAIQADRVAWRLLDTPEFQRLRRIKQLGVSEFVFPGATHSRFAHSVGVFHNSRRMTNVVRDLNGGALDEERENVAHIAALMHDIGHGPFSHAFEQARKAIAKTKNGIYLEHEKISSKLILDPGGAIFPLLSLEFGEDFARDVARLIAADEPEDLYHSIISSSFDADRMDYLQRDRSMTGTRAGATDIEWLLNNLSIYEIPLSIEDEAQKTDEARVKTFVFREKAKQAAEDFLLARHRMFRQVYLHRFTRGTEQLLKALLLFISKSADDNSALRQLALRKDNPLVRFLSDDTSAVANFRRLDDFSVWGSMHQILQGSSKYAKNICSRILERKKLNYIDFSDFSMDNETLSNNSRKIRETFSESLDVDVFEDTVDLTLYGRVGDDAERAHKKVRVLDSTGKAWEISDIPDAAVTLPTTKLTRFYFLHDNDCEKARKIIGR